MTEFTQVDNMNEQGIGETPITFPDKQAFVGDASALKGEPSDSNEPSNQPLETSSALAPELPMDNSETIALNLTSEKIDNSESTSNVADTSIVENTNDKAFQEGTSGNDLIIGMDGPDLVLAGEGNDSVDGGGGDDGLLGQGGNDLLSGSDGNDTVNGGDGNDFLAGGVGNDTLIGGNGDDFLRGGSGDDLLYAGPGNNTLVGGLGADDFSFRTRNMLIPASELEAESPAFEPTSDAIKDFETGVDQVALTIGLNRPVAEGLAPPESGEVTVRTTQEFDDSGLLMGTRVYFLAPEQVGTATHSLLIVNLGTGTRLDFDSSQSGTTAHSVFVEGRQLAWGDEFFRVDYEVLPTGEGTF